MNEYNTCAGKKIGIYKELAVVIVTAFTIAVLTSLGAFIVCRHYGVLVDVTEDCSDYKRKYDIQVMGMVRELDSALSNAMDEISANELDDDKNLGDAMKYLLLNDRLPFATEEVNNMNITITNRNGLVLWRKNPDDNSDDYRRKKVYVDIDERVVNSYDDCSPEYSFVYTKSIKKTLYYIIFETKVTPEYLYADIKLKAACMCLGTVIFIICALLMTKKRIDYIRYLSDVVNMISKGNLDMQIDKRGRDEITNIAYSIDNMQHSIGRMMKEERENDRKNMELITNLSHDIKTPMTIITGYLDVVISHKYDSAEERDTYIKKAFQQVEKINGMIHKIFILARNEKPYGNDGSNGIESSKANKEKCNIAMMLKQDVSEFEGIALKQERNFVADITEKSVYAEVEIEQMREVFDNILMNSIKYSRKNTDIIVTLLEENDNILIKVSNMTDCIKKLDCERIFDKFYRADHARNSSISGNGLGLSIVKETVEGLGGSVLADYDNGLFTISIKLKKCNQNQDQEIR